MSEGQTIGAMGAGGGNVRAAIARAAQSTGVDFQYLMAQARLESALDPSARASTSSAAGLYQFTSGTWLQTLDRHGEAHGLGWAGEAISGGRITDPSLAPQIMALRHDPDASAMMAAELASDNRAQLASVLGREPDASELYLAHFLGSGGATKFLGALATSPEQSAASLLPAAAAANRGIFYEGDGSARSVSGVMDVIRAKVSAAMNEDAGMPYPTGGSGEWASYGRSNTPAAPASQGPFRTSMADTLSAAFGLGAGSAAQGAPDHVRTAYASLRRFGL